MRALDAAARATRRCHPLAVAVACDHYFRLTLARNARASARSGGNDDADAERRASDSLVALGALYGSRGADVSEVSIELAVELEAVAGSDGAVSVDRTFATEAETRRRRTRGETTLVGFYRVVDDRSCASEEDASVFDELCAWARELEGVEEEGLVFLLARAGDEDAEGPRARWYARTIDGFAEQEYAMETRESERIVVDALANIAPEGEGETHSGRFVLSLDAAAAATSALRDRLAVTLEYLDGVRSGTLKVDHDILREIAAVMDILASGSNDAIRHSFDEEQEDVLAVNYLASVTKATDGLNELVDKFHIVHVDRTGDRGPRFFSRARERDRGSPLDAFPDFAGFEEVRDEPPLGT